MPVNARAALLLLASFLLSGCGSTSYADSARDATGKMRTIIQAYNSAAPHDVQSTGQTCQRAYADLGSQAGALDSSSPPSQYRSEASRLRAAYLEARSAFHLCSVSASSMDYVGMARAVELIDTANSEINQARAHDR